VAGDKHAALTGFVLDVVKKALTLYLPFTVRIHTQKVKIWLARFVRMDLTALSMTALGILMGNV